MLDNLESLLILIQNLNIIKFVIQLMNNCSYLIMLLWTSVFTAVVTSIDSIYSQESVTDSNTPEFIAIQHSQSGSISKVNATTYSLELNDVPDKTILFSDRPDRIVTSVSTYNFVGNWSSGKDSFTVDPPNAVLVEDELDSQNTAIIELFNPVYHKDNNVLRYEITQQYTTSTGLPKELGQTTIIIDPINNGGPWTGT